MQKPRKQKKKTLQNQRRIKKKKAKKMERNLGRLMNMLIIVRISTTGTPPTKILALRTMPPTLLKATRFTKT